MASLARSSPSLRSFVAAFHLLPSENMLETSSMTVEVGGLCEGEFILMKRNEE